MRRTQVLLGDREIAALDDARRRTGASRGELIRRAVRQVYGTQSHEPARRPPIRGRFAHLSGSLAAELISDRRAEASHE